MIKITCWEIHKLARNKINMQNSVTGPHTQFVRRSFSCLDETKNYRKMGKRLEQTIH